MRWVKEIYFVAEWFLKYLLNFKMNTNLPQINSSVILFGNGPSVNEINITDRDISEHDIMCVNFFALNEELFFRYQPKYYCIIDPYFFDEENRTEKSDIEKLERVFEKVNWDMTFVTLNNNRIAFTNHNIKIHRINKNIYNGNIKKFRNFIFKNNIGTYRFQNVLNASLYYLITCRSKEIHLFGAENDWHRELFVNEDNEVIREVKHFYGIKRMNLTQIKVIKKGELYKYFYWYYVTLYSHYIASDYATFQEVSVYNCNLDSYIDVFPKKKW